MMEALPLALAALGVSGLVFLFLLWRKRGAELVRLKRSHRKLEELAARRGAELKAADLSLRLILDSLHDAVFVYNLDGAIVDVNRKVLELYEISDRGRVLGTSPLDYTDPELRPDPALDPRAEPPEGTTVSFEWHCLTLETKRRFTARVDLKRLEYRGQPHLLAVVRDTSADKSAEQLQKERHLTRQYLDAVEVLLVGLDENSGVTFLNRKGSQVLGWEVSELGGKDWFRTVLPPDQQASAHSLYRQVLSGLAPEESYESEVITRSGGRRLIAWRSTPVRENQRIVGILSSGDDITEKRSTPTPVERPAPAPVPAAGALPAAWTAAFSGALTQGNVIKLRQLGESAREFDAGLSGWISERVSRYELDELRRFLGTVP